MNTAYELFNLVAPTHLYFGTDFRYKRQAKESFEKLVKNAEKYVQYVQVKSLVSVSFEELDKHDVRTFYNYLFEEIIESEWNELSKTKVIRFGAKGFTKDGRTYFLGDDDGTYAYFGNYMSILESIEYHKKNRRLIG